MSDLLTLDEVAARLHKSRRWLVAWRSREKGTERWRVHTEDPTENLKRYAVGQYEVEPLFARD